MILRHTYQNIPSLYGGRIGKKCLWYCCYDVYLMHAFCGCHTEKVLPSPTMDDQLKFTVFPNRNKDKNELKQTTNRIQTLYFENKMRHFFSHLIFLGWLRGSIEMNSLCSVTDVDKNVVLVLAAMNVYLWMSYGKKYCRWIYESKSTLLMLRKKDVHFECTKMSYRIMKNCKIWNIFSAHFLK